MEDYLENVRKLEEVRRNVFNVTQSMKLKNLKSTLLNHVFGISANRKEG